MLEGLIGRDVTLADVGCTELLGPGDLLRPADQEASSSSMPFDVVFHVDRPVRLAVLDARFAAGVARWPGLAAARL